MPMILAPVRPAPSRRQASGSSVARHLPIAEQIRRSGDVRRPAHPRLAGTVPSTLIAQHGARTPRPEVGMQAQVSILHHDYPARAREQVEQKLQHLVKFYDRIVSMRALLERQHEEHRVEIVAHVARGAVLVVDARSTAFTSALEEAIQRMERLLKKQNDKRMSSRRRGRTGG
jgi:ribosomal subunit interface protein